MTKSVRTQTEPPFGAEEAEMTLGHIECTKVRIERKTKTNMYAYRENDLPRARDKLAARRDCEFRVCATGDHHHFGATSQNALLTLHFYLAGGVISQSDIS